MQTPMAFSKAKALAGKAGHRVRLRYDEMLILCNLMNDCKSYIEVGVYDGLSAWLVGTTTSVKWMRLIDTKFTDAAYERVEKLRDLGVEVGMSEFDAADEGVYYDLLARPKADWCLIDADHSYDATLKHVKLYHNLAKLLVLHDVEMPEVGRVFSEFGGVKIVSTYNYVIAPDGKRLPPLGYGIITGPI